MSKTKIRIVNVKFINEKMSMESVVKECECVNGEYELKINKSFNEVNGQMIRDEAVFMPMCKKGYCMISVCSFNTDEYYEKTLIQKVYGISIIYLQSEMEKCENEIKDLEKRIDNFRFMINEMKK